MADFSDLEARRTLKVPAHPTGVAKGVAEGSPFRLMQVPDNLFGQAQVRGRIGAGEYVTFLTELSAQGAGHSSSEPKLLSVWELLQRARALRKQHTGLDSSAIRRVLQMGTMLDLRPLLEEIPEPAATETTGAETTTPDISVDTAWIERGAEIGFLPVTNDVAVLESQRQTYPGWLATVGDITERVQRLREALGEDCTVAVAATNLSPQAAERILWADAYVLPVSEAFWDMSAEDRLRHVRERIPVSVDDLEERIEQVRSRLPQQDPVPDIYAGPNPLIGAEGFADWARKVSESPGRS